MEAICKKGGVFKYPKVFQCDNGSAFKSDVTKLLEKHDVDIRRTKTKYKHTNAAFVEVFNKELTKLLLSSWMLKSFRTPKKYRQYESIVNKMNNTKSSKIDVKSKDAIKQILLS